MTKERYKISPVCWASATGNCEGDLTKEHIISESILKIFLPITATYGDKTIKLGKGSCVLKRLCEKHNRDLSSYDAEAYKLFSGLKLISEGNSEEGLFQFNKGTYILDLSREKIEKWYAKTFFNYVLFNVTLFEPENLPFHVNPHSIVKKLYQAESFEKPFGLYLINPDKPLLRKEVGISFRVIESKDAYIIKQNGRTTENYDIPLCFYSNIFGIELAALFNITPIQDNQCIDGHLKPVITMLEERASFDFQGFGYRIDGVDGQRDMRILLQ